MLLPLVPTASRCGVHRGCVCWTWLQTGCSQAWTRHSASGSWVSASLHVRHQKLGISGIAPLVGEMA